MSLTELIVMAALVPAPTLRDSVEALFAAFNRHDVKALEAFYAADAKLTSSDFCAPRGKGDVARTYGALFAAVTDIRDQVETILVEGDRVAVRFTSIGHTPQGELKLKIMTFLRFRDGLIVEDDTVFDTGGRPCEP